MATSARIHYLELEEFIISILGLDEDSNINDIDNALMEHYSIDFDNLHKLLEKIMPMITVAQSPLTEKYYKGFAGDGMWLLKIEV